MHDTDTDMEDELRFSRAGAEVIVECLDQIPTVCAMGAACGVLAFAISCATDFATGVCV